MDNMNKMYWNNDIHMECLIIIGDASLDKKGSNIYNDSNNGESESNMCKELILNWIHKEACN